MIGNLDYSWFSLMPVMYDHQHMSSDYGVIVVPTQHSRNLVKGTLASHVGHHTLLGSPINKEQNNHFNKNVESIPHLNGLKLTYQGFICPKFASLPKLPG